MTLRDRWQLEIRLRSKVRKVAVFGLLVVFETREFVQPGELDVARGTIALLADQQIGLAFHALAILVVRLIELFAVDECYNVCVLLDRTRFAEVAELRLVVARGLDLAVELRKAQDWDAELPSETFQAAR